MKQLIYIYVYLRIKSSTDASACIYLHLTIKWVDGWVLHAQLARVCQVLKKSRSPASDGGTAVAAGGINDAGSVGTSPLLCGGTAVADGGTAVAADVGEAIAKTDVSSIWLDQVSIPQIVCDPIPTS